MGALEASRDMETGQVASRAVPVPGPMVEQGIRAAMVYQGTRAAMVDQGIRVGAPPPPPQNFLGEVHNLWGALWSGLCEFLDRSGLWRGLGELLDRSGLWSGLGELLEWSGSSREFQELTESTPEPAPFQELTEWSGLGSQKPGSGPPIALT